MRNVAVKSPNPFQVEIVDASRRNIAFRTRGSAQGPIVRLVSPSDLGQVIKPFVFLDRFDIQPTPEEYVNQALLEHYHPHSGIMTVTVILSGEFLYEDTAGGSGILSTGSVEYMRAGAGVWHTATPVGPKNVKGFQLWVALPPNLEHAPALSHYLMPENVETDGPVRVILGSYGQARSRVLSEVPMTYLHVSLDAGESWIYEPQTGYDVAWVAVHEGELKTDDETLGKEVAVFDEGSQAIEFTAVGKTDFVLGAAKKHPHNLVLGSYSVHSNHEALMHGQAEIKRLGKSVRRH